MRDKDAIDKQEALRQDASVQKITKEKMLGQKIRVFVVGIEEIFYNLLSKFLPKIDMVFYVNPNLIKIFIFENGEIVYSQKLDEINRLLHLVNSIIKKYRIYDLKVIVENINLINIKKEVPTEVENVFEYVNNYCTYSESLESNFTYYKLQKKSIHGKKLENSYKLNINSLDYRNIDYFFYFKNIHNIFLNRIIFLKTETDFIVSEIFNLIKRRINFEASLVMVFFIESDFIYINALNSDMDWYHSYVSSTDFYLKEAEIINAVLELRETAVFHYKKINPKYIESPVSIIIKNKNQKDSHLSLLEEYYDFIMYKHKYSKDIEFIAKIISKQNDRYTCINKEFTNYSPVFKFDSFFCKIRNFFLCYFYFEHTFLIPKVLIKYPYLINLTPN